MVTDRERGDLRPEADEKGYTSFVIPDDIALNFVATSRGLLQNVSYANIPKNQGFRKK